VLKLLSRHPVNVTTADLIGPDRPAYLAGAQVLEVYPVLPLMANVSLGVGALSYAGRFFVTVVADRDAYPDLDVFVAGLRAAWAALSDTVSVGAGSH
jgi:diacylglycerol O-acyltransferase / wax synthase